MSRYRSSSGIPTRLLFLLFAAVALLLSACGSSSSFDTSDEAVEVAASSEDSGDSGSDGGFETADDSDEAMFEDDAMEEAEFDEPTSATVGAEAPADGDGQARSQDLGSSGATATQQTAADFGRKIIFTADITVEVDDVAAAGQQATDVIASVGGFVFGQQTQGGTRPESVLVFKVLPENFDRAVEELGNVGELRNQVISADDVTERVVNLETRIEVAQLGVERLRAALEGSQDLEDYAELERLLLDRESELELMRGSLRTLQDRIDLATITLRLVQDAVNHSMLLNTTVYHAQDGGASCPGSDSNNVESGTDITICFEVINTGEEPVADLAFIDTALGIDSADDLIVVFGDLDRLDGGQSLMLAYETTAERRTQLRPKVTARPITEDGEPAGPPIDARDEAFLDTFEPATDPGFTDGFDAGVDVLQGVWTAAKVVVGFLLPMLVLLAAVFPIVWFGRRWLSDRKLRNQPPPPSAPTPSASVTADRAAESTADSGAGSATE